MHLTFDQLRNINVTRCEEIFHTLNSWGPTDWAAAMAGECGEACNVTKKIRRLQISPRILPDRTPEYQNLVTALGTELADTVIYADLFAARMGLDLGQCVVDKFNADSIKRNSKNFLSDPRVPTNCVLYPLKDLKNVKEGLQDVMLKRYWLVTPDRFTVFSAKPFEPMCHKSRSTMEVYLVRFPKLLIKFVEIAYLPKKEDCVEGVT